MIGNMKKALAFVSAMLMVIIMAFGFAPIETYAADFSTENSQFIDGAGFFSKTQKEELNNAIKQTAEKLKLNIIVFAASDLFRSYDDSIKESYSEDTYNDICGKGTDGVFYFMDTLGASPAYDFIFTSGKAIPFYEPKIDLMFDVIFKYLPPSNVGDYEPYTEDFCKGVRAFLNQLEKYDKTGRRVSYYDKVAQQNIVYTKSGKTIITDGPPPIKRLQPLVVAFPAALIFGLIFYFGTEKKYLFKSPQNPRVYVSDNESRFTRKSDNYIRTYTTKHRIQSNSSSHRSGGGHRSGGSHHHGGGRHR